MPSRLCKYVFVVFLVKNFLKFICNILANLHIPSKLNKKTGRGIDEGSGVCFCDSFGSCGCDKPKKIKKGRVKSTTLSPINSTAMANLTSIVSDSSPQPSIVQANIGRHTGVVLGK